MNQKQTQAFYKTLAAALTEKDFLRKAGLKKKTILALLGKRRWLEGLEGVLREEVSCGAVLGLCREAMPFDTLAHVAGVQHVAMRVGRQLAKAGVPVDLGLISGAAAGHDIGKYGCRDSEAKRIPYLHYYTDI